MKTPDEIKKLLETVTITVNLDDPLGDRRYRLDVTKPVREDVIQAICALESRLAQVERERDELLKERCSK